MIHIGESGGYRVGEGLIRIEACPRRFGRKGSKIKNFVARLLSILRERRKNETCCYLVSESDSWGAWCHTKMLARG